MPIPSTGKSRLTRQTGTKQRSRLVMVSTDFPVCHSVFKKLQTRHTIDCQKAICTGLLDHIVIFLKTVQEHSDYLWTVLEWLWRAGVSLKLKSCFIFEDGINFLGHILQPGRLGISAKAKDAIKGLRHPIIVTELKFFLSLCNAFRRFVPNFARIAATPYKKLKKDQPIHF